MAMLGYSRSNRLGVSAIIGLGNKSDIDEYDLIEYFGRDEGTSLLALHIEGIRDGRAILEAAKRVAKKKPILALKAGRTLEGMKAASSHTGSLASDPVMVDQLFGSSGILLVQGMNLFFDSIKGLAMIPKPSGEEVLIVTGAGGLGVLLSDACIQNGLRLLKPPQDLLDEAKKFVPPFGTLGNPIDITGGQPPETYEDVLRLVLKDDRVHAIVLGYWQTLIAPPMDFAKGVVKVFSELPRKPLVVSLSGDVEVEKAAEYLEENGIPATCYAPERAVSMLAAKLKWVQRQPC
jgi:acyl-CoA synthetase (NDP forming)